MRIDLEELLDALAVILAADPAAMLSLIALVAVLGLAIVAVLLAHKKAAQPGQRPNHAARDGGPWSAAPPHEDLSDSPGRCS